MSTHSAVPAAGGPSLSILCVPARGVIGVLPEGHPHRPPPLWAAVGVIHARVGINKDPGLSDTHEECLVSDINSFPEDRRERVGVKPEDHLEVREVACGIPAPRALDLTDRAAPTTLPDPSQPSSVAPADPGGR